MSNKDSLGDRMKEYEEVSKTKLTNRTPVIIRLDGKAFHTWTKKLRKDEHAIDPFSDEMHGFMVNTTRCLVTSIQNAVFAYTQSDEISILLNDWKKLTTDQWFGNSIQKMTSVSSSIATNAFNFEAGINGYIEDLNDMACFDSRVFNIPKEEVVNYFLWRQQDATRNSINMLGQYYFSHSEMQNKNVSQVQDMLMLEENVNWNDIDTWKKRGTCVTSGIMHGDSYTTSGLDEEIPIFSQDVNFIEQFLQSNEEHKNG